MSEPSADYLKSRGAYNRRARLLRIVMSRVRKPTPAELALLDALLVRANPTFQRGKSRFIGMHAVSLTRSNLSVVDDMCLVCHKVDGIGALLAMVTPPLSALGDHNPEIAFTAFLVLRDGTVHAIAPVAIVRRFSGRVLLDGEICLRKIRLTYAEEQRIQQREPDVLDFDDGNPACDSYYELCYAAHDALVIDDAAQTQTTARSRLREPVANADFPERSKFLFALLEVRPTDDSRAYDELNRIVTALNDRQLAMRIFCKMPIVGAKMRTAIDAPPISVLQGVPLDGLVLTPSKGAYRPGICPQLLKYKARQDHNIDVFVRRDEEGKAWRILIRQEQTLICVSTHMWYGTHESEVEEVKRLLELARAFKTETNRDLVLECRPYYPPAVERKQRQERAPIEEIARELYWQPIGQRPEKRAPNSREGFLACVAAFADHVSARQLVEHVEKCKLNRGHATN
jgi:hypothetical protein